MNKSIVIQTIFRIFAALLIKKWDYTKNMMGYYNEPKLTYALDLSGKMVYIGDVERGLHCNCRCPRCNELLVAKLGHEGGHQPHFAHQRGGDCHGSYMTAVHRLAEQIIEEEKTVMAPAYNTFGEQKLLFEKVEVEQRIERLDLQPDLVGITEDGMRWFIEIRNTHEVDENKKTKIKESFITCLEIDVRNQTLESLKSFLLESAEARKWINNPNYDSKIANNKRRLISKIEDYLLNQKVLVIPAFSRIESQRICIDNISASHSEDGMYVRIIIETTEGEKYIIHICDIEIQMLEPVKKHNELAIFIDNIIDKTDIQLSDLVLKWIYHVPSVKIEEKVKIREYRNNPKYEIRSPYYCSKICQYTPQNGKCIYQIEKLFYQGRDYVACNEEKKRNDEPKYTSLSDDEINEPVDNLPFEKFWTLDDLSDYYKNLSSSGYYNGAKILYCVMNNSKIIVIGNKYKEGRRECLYPITEIFIIDGKLKTNNWGDFTNRSYAMDFYRMLTSSNATAAPHKDELPF